MGPSPHEQIISETRAVQEAIARLGTSATSEEIQRFLEDEGVRLSVDFIERVRAQQHRVGT